MPRRVVPIEKRPRRISEAPSSITWYGMIRCALPLRRSVVERHPALLELVELGAERPGVDHGAVADHAEGAGVEDPRRHEVQLVDLVPGDDGVPGVVAALVAGDDVAALGEEVDHLALALVAPLGPDHHGGGH